MKIMALLWKTFKSHAGTVTFSSQMTSNLNSSLLVASFLVGHEAQRILTSQVLYIHNTILTPNKIAADRGRQGT